MKKFTVIAIVVVVCGVSFVTSADNQHSKLAAPPDPNDEEQPEGSGKIGENAKRHLRYLYGDAYNDYFEEDNLGPYAKSFWNKYYNYMPQEQPYLDPTFNSFNIPLDAYVPRTFPTGCPTRKCGDTNVIVVNPKSQRPKKPLNDILRLDNPSPCVDAVANCNRKPKPHKKPSSSQRGGSEYRDNLMKNVLKIVNYVQDKQTKESKKPKKPKNKTKNQKPPCVDPMKELKKLVNSYETTKCDLPCIGVKVDGRTVSKIPPSGLVAIPCEDDTNKCLEPIEDCEKKPCNDINKALELIKTDCGCNEKEPCQDDTKPIDPPEDCNRIPEPCNPPTVPPPVVRPPIVPQQPHSSPKVLIEKLVLVNGQLPVQQPMNHISNDLYNSIMTMINNYAQNGKRPEIQGRPGGVSGGLLPGVSDTVNDLLGNVNGLVTGGGQNGGNRGGLLPGVSGTVGDLLTDVNGLLTGDGSGGKGGTSAGLLPGVSDTVGDLLGNVNGLVTGQGGKGGSTDGLLPGVSDTVGDLLGNVNGLVTGQGGKEGSAGGLLPGVSGTVGDLLTDVNGLLTGDGSGGKGGTSAGLLPGVSDTVGDLVGNVNGLVTCQGGKGGSTDGLLPGVSDTVGDLLGNVNGLVTGQGGTGGSAGGLLPGVSGTVGDLLTDVNGLLTGGGSGGKGGTSAGLLPGVSDTVGDLLGNVNGIVTGQGGTGGSAGGLLPGVSGTVGDLLTDVNGLLTGGGSGGKGGTPAGLLPGVSDTVGDLLGNVNGLVTGQGGKGGSADGLLPGVSDTVGDLLGNVNGLVTGQGGKEGSAGGLLPGVSGTVGDLLTDVNGLLTGGGSGGKGGTSAGLLPGVSDTVGDLLGNVNGLVTGQGGTGGSAGGLLPGVSGTVGDLLTDVNGLLTGGESGGKGGTSAGLLPGVSDTVGDLLGNVNGLVTGQGGKGGSADGLLPGVSDTVGDLLCNVNGLVTGQGGKGGSAGGLLPGVSGTVGDLLTDVNGLLTGGGSGGKGGTSAGLLPGVSDTVGDLLGNVNGLVTGQGGTGGSAGGLLPGVSGTVGDLLTDVNGLLTGGGSGGKGGTSAGLLPGVSDTVGDLLGNVNGLVTGQGGKGGSADGLLPGVSDTVGDLLGNVNGLVTGQGGKEGSAGGLLPGVSGTVGDLLTDVNGLLTGGGSGGKGGTSAGLLPGVSDTVGDLLGNVNELVTGQGGTGGSAGGLLPGVSGTVGDLLTDVNGLLTGGGSGGKGGTSAGLLPGVSDTVGDLLGNVNGLVTGQGDKGGSAGGLLPGVSGTVGDLLTDVNGLLTGGGSGGKGGTSAGLLPGVSDTVGDLLGNVNGLVTGQGGKGGSADGLLPGVSDTVGDLLGNVNELVTGQGGKDGIAGGLLSGVSETVNELLDNVNGLVTGEGSQDASVGGLLPGLSDTVGDLVDNVNGLLVGDDGSKSGKKDKGKDKGSHDPNQNGGGNESKDHGHGGKDGNKGKDKPKSKGGLIGYVYGESAGKESKKGGEEPKSVENNGLLSLTSEIVTKTIEKAPQEQILIQRNFVADEAIEEDKHTIDDNIKDVFGSNIKYNNLEPEADTTVDNMNGIVSSQNEATFFAQQSEVIPKLSQSLPSGETPITSDINLKSPAQQFPEVNIDHEEYEPKTKSKAGIFRRVYNWFTGNGKHKEKENKGVGELVTDAMSDTTADKINEVASPQNGVTFFAEQSETVAKLSQNKPPHEIPINTAAIYELPAQPFLEKNVEQAVELDERNILIETRPSFKDGEIGTGNMMGAATNAIKTPSFNIRLSIGGAPVGGFDKTTLENLARKLQGNFDGAKIIVEPMVNGVQNIVLPSAESARLDYPEPIASKVDEKTLQMHDPIKIVEDNPIENAATKIENISVQYPKQEAVGANVDSNQLISKEETEVADDILPPPPPPVSEMENINQLGNPEISADDIENMLPAETQYGFPASLAIRNLRVDKDAAKLHEYLPTSDSKMVYPSANDKKRMAFQDTRVLIEDESNEYIENQQHAAKEICPFEEYAKKFKCNSISRLTSTSGEHVQYKVLSTVKNSEERQLPGDVIMNPPTVGEHKTLENPSTFARYQQGQDYQNELARSENKKFETTLKQPFDLSNSIDATKPSPPVRPLFIDNIYPDKYSLKTDTLPMAQITGRDAGSVVKDTPIDASSLLKILLPTSSDNTSNNENDEKASASQQIEEAVLPSNTVLNSLLPSAEIKGSSRDYTSDSSLVDVVMRGTGPKLHFAPALQHNNMPSTKSKLGKDSIPNKTKSFYSQKLSQNTHNAGKHLNSMPTMPTTLSITSVTSTPSEISETSIPDMLPHQPTLNNFPPRPMLKSKTQTNSESAPKILPEHDAIYNLGGMQKGQETRLSYNSIPAPDDAHKMDKIKSSHTSPSQTDIWEAFLAGFSHGRITQKMKHTEPIDSTEHSLESASQSDSSEESQSQNAHIENKHWLNEGTNSIDNKKHSLTKRSVDGDVEAKINEVFRPWYHEKSLLETKSATDSVIQRRINDVFHPHGFKSVEDEDYDYPTDSFEHMPFSHEDRNEKNAKSEENSVSTPEDESPENIEKLFENRNEEKENKIKNYRYEKKSKTIKATMKKDPIINYLKPYPKKNTKKPQTKSYVRPNYIINDVEPTVLGVYQENSQECAKYYRQKMAKFLNHPPHFLHSVETKENA